MHWESRLRQLASAQAGVVGIDQLPAIGAGGDQWRSARSNGRWEPLSRRVLQLAGAPTTDATRAHAGILDAGGEAVLHGPAALAWFGHRAFDLSTIHVTRRRGTTTTSCDLAVVHRVRGLEARDIQVVRGVPTVKPLRAIWSEASRWADPRTHELAVRRIGRILDDAHTDGLLTWHDLHASIDRLARRGRAGTTIMRACAVKRPPGSTPTESRLEDRFEEILDRYGAPGLARQVVVGEDEPIGRCDFADTDRPMVVEVNSEAFHSTLSDQEDDERRYDKLFDIDRTVVVVWEKALWTAPRSVVEAVREGRRRADRGDPAILHTPGCPWPPDPARIVIGEQLRRYRG